MKKKTLTHQQFFTACDDLRNRREELLKTCHSYADAAAFLAAALGVEVAISAARMALESTAIVLDKPPKMMTGRQLNNSRILSRALVHLYKKLGEEVPTDLTELLHRLDHGDTVQPRPASPPVPISSVPNPRTVSLANGRLT